MSWRTWKFLISSTSWLIKWLTSWSLPVHWEPHIPIDVGMDMDTDTDMGMDMDMNWYGYKCRHGNRDMDMDRYRYRHTDMDIDSVSYRYRYLSQHFLSTSPRHRTYMFIWKLDRSVEPFKYLLCDSYGPGTVLDSGKTLVGKAAVGQLWIPAALGLPWACTKSIWTSSMIGLAAPRHLGRISGAQPEDKTVVMPAHSPTPLPWHQTCHWDEINSIP